MSYSPNFRGSTAAGTSQGNASSYQNGTGSTIGLASAVSVNLSSQLVFTDVSSEASAEGWLGIAAAPIPISAFGQITSEGRIQNIPLGLGFAVGDPIWVGNSPGTLTNIRPDLTVIGWSVGDFVLFVGVVVQNEFNPSNQDIQLSRQIIGQL